MFNLLQHIHQFNLKANKNNPWIGSPFEELYHMQADQRGKYGEELFSCVIHELGWNIDADVTDQNKHTDGIYDIKANNKRFEVKTSCLSHNSWQHEPLYITDVCDIVVFIDFDYNHFYITMVKNEELPLDKSISISKLFGKKHGTLRKNKDDGYKLDFSHTTISNLTKQNRCKKFDKDVSMEELKQYVEEVFNDLL